MLVCVFFMCSLHTRPRVQRAPGLPCALFLLGRRLVQNPGETRRENAGDCLRGCLTIESEMDDVRCTSLVIPGCAPWRRPGIHTPGPDVLRQRPLTAKHEHGGYGFRTAAARLPE